MSIKMVVRKRRATSKKQLERKIDGVRWSLGLDPLKLTAKQKLRMIDRIIEDKVPPALR